MNVVLYDIEMEPITILDIPMWAFQRLRDGERFVMAVADPLSWSPADENIASVSFRTVCIQSHRLRALGKETVILVTGDDVNALLLEPSWLPGQRRSINEMKQTNSMLVSMLLNSLRRGG